MLKTNRIGIGQSPAERQGDGQSCRRWLRWTSRLSRGDIRTTGGGNPRTGFRRPSFCRDQASTSRFGTCMSWASLSLISVTTGRKCQRVRVHTSPRPFLDRAGRLWENGSQDGVHLLEVDRWAQDRLDHDGLGRGRSAECQAHESKATCQ